MVATLNGRTVLVGYLSVLRWFQFSAALLKMGEGLECESTENGPRVTLTFRKQNSCTRMK